MLDLYLDADACPVKEEAYRVATRHGMTTYVVTCLPMRDPARPGVTLVQVPQGPDFADDWIVERIAAGDVCVTDDIPLAARCIKQDALVLTPRGRLLHKGNIGELLATRDLMDRLRSEAPLSEGQLGGPRPFEKRDRSRFLEQLEHAIRSIRKSIE